MEAPGSQNEAGFGLIELLISMVVLQVALLALISAFSSSAVALGRAGSLTTAAVLADAHLELYRSMPYDAIGLDTGTTSAPTTGMYVSDTDVCPSGQTPACSNTGPRNNALTATPWNCPTSVDANFTANGVKPCLAHQLVSGAAAPDGKTYYVDTYIFFTPAVIGQTRATKRVSVVVRNSAGTTELAKVITSFDCSTGQPVPRTNTC